MTVKELVDLALIKSLVSELKVKVRKYAFLPRPRPTQFACEVEDELDNIEILLSQMLKDGKENIE